MVFKGRKNWNNVAAGRGLAVERNKEKRIKGGDHYV
jgi:hypothetical protein